MAIGTIETLNLTSSGDSSVRPASGTVLKLISYFGGGNDDVGISITDGTDACKITSNYSGSKIYTPVTGDASSSGTLSSSAPFAVFLTNDLWLTLSGTTVSEFFYVAYQVIDE